MSHVDSFALFRLNLGAGRGEKFLTFRPGRALWGMISISMATDTRPEPLPDHDSPESLSTDQRLFLVWQANGDDATFQALFARHAPKVVAVCRRCLGDGQDADDALQSTFIILARRGKSLRDAGRLGPWLHTTAVRVCSHARRAAERRHRHEAVASTPANGGPGPDWDQARPLLDAAIEALNGTQRAAVIGFYLHNKPQAQVAAELGCSVAAVKMRLQAGLARLRQVLRRRGVALSAAAMAGGLATEAQAAAEPVTLTFAPGAGAKSLAAAVVKAAMVKSWLIATAAMLVLSGAAATWALAPRPRPAPLAVAEAPADPPGVKPDDPWLRPDPATANSQGMTSLAMGMTAELRDAALLGKPFSLLRDPGATPAVAKVTAELERWNEMGSRAYNFVPSLVELVRESRGLNAQMQIGNPLPGKVNTTWLVGIHPGNAHGVLSAFRSDGTQQIRIGDYQGWTRGGLTTIATSDHWFMGNPDAAVGARLHRNHSLSPRSPDAPLWFRYDGFQNQLKPGARPAIFFTSRPGPDGFVTRLELTDQTAPAAVKSGSFFDNVRWITPRFWQDLPWRPVRTDLNRASGPHDLVLTVGLDPTDPGLSSLLAEILPAHPVAEILSGDLLVEADWHAGPLPTFRAVLGLRKADAATKAVERLAAAQNWKRSTDGKDWTILSPIGLLTLRQDRDRLLLVSDPTWFEAKPEGKPVSTGAALCLRLDLPSLGKAWLPIAMGMLVGQRRYVEHGPWFWNNVVATEAGFSISDNVKKGFHTPSPSRILSWNSIYSLEERCPAFMANLAMIFGREDFSRRVDQGLAIWTQRIGDPPKAHPSQRHATIIMRIAEGFVCYSSDTPQGVTPWDYETERRNHTFTRAELDRRLVGWTRYAGPDLDALPLVTIPAPVVFDQTWLPPLDAILRHLPSRHEITIRPLMSGGAKMGIAIEEVGLPILPLVPAGLLLSAQAHGVPAASTAPDRRKTGDPDAAVKPSMPANPAPTPPKVDNSF